MAPPSAPSQAAKQFSGVTLNMTYEAGLQALDPRNFSGPLWEQLTGIKSNVVELSHPGPVFEADRRAHRRLRRLRHPRHRSRPWTPSLADGGVIAPLDDYIAKYMNKADLDDYHPLYKALPTYKGKIWGFFDDGDMFALYYRKDIFKPMLCSLLARLRIAKSSPRLGSDSYVTTTHEPGGDDPQAHRRRGPGDRLALSPRGPGAERAGLAAVALPWRLVPLPAGAAAEAAHLHELLPRLPPQRGGRPAASRGGLPRGRRDSSAAWTSRDRPDRGASGDARSTPPRTLEDEDAAHHRRASATAHPARGPAALRRSASSAGIDPEATATDLRPIPSGAQHE